MQPDFLDLADVLIIYQDQVHRYGGALGIRDRGLLESAVAMPQSGSGDSYAHCDIFEMAAAYLYHLVRNHPFLDGNKLVKCSCGFEKSVWEHGGVRWKAHGKARQYVRCDYCRKASWHEVYKK